MSSPARPHRSPRALGALLAIGLLPLAPTLAPGAITSVAALPVGFTQTNVASVAGATGIEQLPDGRVVVLQQTGQVRIILSGALLPGNALDISVCTGSERGMLGFTADPQFP